MAKDQDNPVVKKEVHIIQDGFERIHIVDVDCPCEPSVEICEEDDETITYFFHNTVQ